MQQTKRKGDALYSLQYRKRMRKDDELILRDFDHPRMEAGSYGDKRSGSKTDRRTRLPFSQTPTRGPQSSSLETQKESEPDMSLLQSMVAEYLEDGGRLSQVTGIEDHYSLVSAGGGAEHLPATDLSGGILEHLGTSNTRGARRTNSIPYFPNEIDLACPTKPALGVWNQHAPLSTEDDPEAVEDDFGMFSDDNDSEGSYCDYPEEESEHEHSDMEF